MEPLNNPARNRIDDRTLFIGMPLLVVALVLAIWGYGYHHIQAGSALETALGVLIALLYVGFIVNFGLYLAEEKDEFERAVLSQSMLWGGRSDHDLHCVLGSSGTLRQCSSFESRVVRASVLFVHGRRTNCDQAEIQMKNGLRVPRASEAEMRNS